MIFSDLVVLVLSLTMHDFSSAFPVHLMFGMSGNFLEIFPCSLHLKQSPACIVLAFSVDNRCAWEAEMSIGLGLV